MGQKDDLRQRATSGTQVTAIIGTETLEETEQQRTCFVVIVVPCSLTAFEFAAFL